MAVKEPGGPTARNPFAPSFGISPPVLAGRGDVLDGIGDALTTGPTHPDYTMLLVGVRGAGKTVTLNAVEELARHRGWLTLAGSTSPADLASRSWPTSPLDSESTPATPVSTATACCESASSSPPDGVTSPLPTNQPKTGSATNPPTTKHFGTSDGLASCCDYIMMLKRYNVESLRLVKTRMLRTW